MIQKHHRFQSETDFRIKQNLQDFRFQNQADFRISPIQGRHTLQNQTISEL